MKLSFLSQIFPSSKEQTCCCASDTLNEDWPFSEGETIGIIAGNGSFPLRFAKSAKAKNLRVAALCHVDETDPSIRDLADSVEWVKVGQLGGIIDFFKAQGVKKAVMAGGISRVRTFRDVKLDARGVLLLAKIRSAKDDLIMRGVADELEREGIRIIESTVFARENLVSEGMLCGPRLTEEQKQDIELGRQAIRSMVGLHVGQLVVVKEGVIVAIEAVEGSDEAIRRGCKLGGPGAVVVKCAKPDQDMRFDVPVVGPKTIDALREGEASVLALESGRSLVFDREDFIQQALAANISVVGCPKLI